MDVLFVHNNFPGQYRHIARALQHMGGFRLFGIGAKTAPGLPGVTTARYTLDGMEPARDVHPFARRFEGEMRRAAGVMRAAVQLRDAAGMDPAVILVHPGWGENTPLRSLFPRARMISFCEFYYGPGADVGFDPEFSKPTPMDYTRLNAWNASTLLALTDSDAAIAPTEWQRSRYPALFRPMIHTVHDGVDTRVVRPGPAELWEHGDLRIEPGEEIITFVARNLEPYRGYHIFMRALPRILKARPSARVVIVGGDGVSYGARPPQGQTWRQIFLDEVKDRLDLARVSFTGALPYDAYLRLLRHSRAHVYLTYPFVLSWSMLEAMASGCLVVGSATEPVQEVIAHGVNGLLTPFFDQDALVEAVVSAAAEPERYAPLREAARKTVVERYDLTTICLPRQLAIMRVGSEQSTATLLAAPSSAGHA